MKSLRDEIDYVVFRQISFHPRRVLGFHLNAVKISSAKADFITVGDFIILRSYLEHLRFSGFSFLSMLCLVQVYLL